MLENGDGTYRINKGSQDDDQSLTATEATEMLINYAIGKYNSIANYREKIRVLENEIISHNQEILNTFFIKMNDTLQGKYEGQVLYDDWKLKIGTADPIDVEIIKSNAGLLRLKDGTNAGSFLIKSSKYIEVKSYFPETIKMAMIANERRMIYHGELPNGDKVRLYRTK